MIRYCGGCCHTPPSATYYQRTPSERGIAILDQIDPDSLIGIMDLAFLESARLEVEEPPVLCDALLEIAHRLYDRLHDDDDPNDPDFPLCQDTWRHNWRWCLMRWARRAGRPRRS